MDGRFEISHQSDEPLAGGLKWTTLLSSPGILAAYPCIWWESALHSPCTVHPPRARMHGREDEGRRARLSRLPGPHQAPCLTIDGGASAATQDDLFTRDRGTEYLDCQNLILDIENASTVLCSIFYHAYDAHFAVMSYLLPGRENVRVFPHSKQQSCSSVATFYGAPTSTQFPRLLRSCRTFHRVCRFSSGRQKKSQINTKYTTE